MLPGPFDPFWVVVAFVFGAVIGSFLNVVIWRVPRGESIVSPGSHCPHCDRPLQWYENIPLLSFLALRGRCRTCKGPIAPRYFWVELLTALVIAGIIRLYGATVDGITLCIFAAALIAAFAIDIEHYIIPDSINTVALLAGFARDFWGIAVGDPRSSLVWGWMPRSILGAVICTAVFVGIQAMGLTLFRRDAMGDGDLKLARAIGAMMPLSLAIVSFLFAVGAGAVIGGGACVVRARRRKAAASSATEESDELPEPPPPTPWSVFALGSLLYLTFADLVVEAAYALKVGWARRFVEWLDSRLPEEDENEFVPTATQMPFGPFMVIGAFLSLVVGQRVIDWYLQWSGLSSGL